MFRGMDVCICVWMCASVEYAGMCVCMCACVRVDTDL